MKDLRGAIVLITGATSGIGKATALRFAGVGVNLIITGRREELLGQLSSEIKNEFGINVSSFRLDVRDYDAVRNAVDSLPQEWKGIDILVNNAGLARGLSKLHEGSLDDWNEMIDTNVKGLLHVSRCVIPLMAERKKGHVINIGSIAGHEVYPNGNVYCGTKHAVDAITQGMRMDLNGTNVKVTTIDPGLVETEFAIVRFRGDAVRAKSVYSGMAPLTPEDVADAIMYAVTCPENMVVAQMVLLPVAQASAMVVDRKSQS